MIQTITDFSKAIFSSLLILITPVHGILMAVFLLVFFDTITGIIKAIHLKQGITSKRLSVVISKLLLYFSSIFIIYFVDEYITNDFLLMTFSCEYLLSKLTGIMIAIIEIKSIAENIESITGFNFGKFFKSSLRRIKDIKTEMDEIQDTDWKSKREQKETENE